jgi:RimJ/RimL family protein N-acetyltransferase
MRWPMIPPLSGQHVRLVPLAAEHEPGLVRAVEDGELWKLWYTTVPSPETMGAVIAERLREAEAGTLRPFAVLDAQGVPVGMTNCMRIDARHKRLEIGGTWYSARVQRSALNTECKLLLLGHAFEALECIAVELRTHRLNVQSRRAIERLGAQLDGILRSHERMPDGTLRDTAVYSITAGEWPTVRTHLRHQLQRPR